MYKETAEKVKSIIGGSMTEHLDGTYTIRVENEDGNSLEFPVDGLVYMVSHKGNTNYPIAYEDIETLAQFF